MKDAVEHAMEILSDRAAGLEVEAFFDRPLLKDRGPEDGLKVMSDRGWSRAVTTSGLVCTIDTRGQYPLKCSDTGMLHEDARDVGHVMVAYLLSGKWTDVSVRKDDFELEDVLRDEIPTMVWEASSDAGFIGEMPYQRDTLLEVVADVYPPDFHVMEVTAEMPYRINLPKASTLSEAHIRRTVGKWRDIISEEARKMGKRMDVLDTLLHA